MDAASEDTQRATAIAVPSAEDAAGIDIVAPIGEEDGGERDAKRAPNSRIGTFGFHDDELPETGFVRLRSPVLGTPSTAVFEVSRRAGWTTTRSGRTSTRLDDRGNVWRVVERLDGDPARCDKVGGETPRFRPWQQRIGRIRVKRWIEMRDIAASVSINLTLTPFPWRCADCGLTQVSYLRNEGLSVVLGTDGEVTSTPQEPRARTLLAWLVAVDGEIPREHRLPPSDDPRNLYPPADPQNPYGGRMKAKRNVPQSSDRAVSRFCQS